MFFKLFSKLRFILFLSLIFFLGGAHLALAQKGRLVGKVVDADFGKGMPGINIVLENTTIGGATNINGEYRIENIPVGKYSVIATFIGYARKRIEGVKISADRTETLNFSMAMEVLEGEEVVVTAKAVKNTEAALLKNRQKAAGVSDAVSAEAISQSGAGDAAEAMKQVTGASVVDGKYVFVRGLGGRYASTHLNGAELPSSDPNRKTFQMDLIPTNLLENIVITKTFTPDKPGNFSGGIVNIDTKKFPAKPTFKFSTSASLNSYTTFNENSLTYKGADGNFLGFDDGIRDIPSVLSNINTKIPVVQEARYNPELAQQLDQASKAFNSVMDFSHESVPLKRNFALSVSGELRTGKESLFGYLGSVTYSRDFSFYDDGKIGRYILTDVNASELDPRLILNDTRSSVESYWGGLANLSYEFSNYHQIHANLFYNKCGTSETRFMEGGWPQEFGTGGDAPTYFNRVLSYIERDVRSIQFSGEHFFKPIWGMTLDWNVSLAKTSQVEPDRRLITTAEQIINDRTNYIITGSGFDDPSRYYRNLEDNSNTFSINLKIPFIQWAIQKGDFKIGAYFQNLDRDFNERIFSYHVDNRLFNDLGGEIEALFSPEYLGIISNDTLSNGNVRYNFGNTIRDNSKLRNQYTGDQGIVAYYGMIDLNILQSLRIITGLRYETTDLNVISDEPNIEPGKINEDDILPSVNLVYKTTDNMNIRAAATKTLARPTFREIAPFSSKEFINDVELQGNPDLKRTLIANYDLRWEWFLNPGEILAISGFYKEMENPIELAFAEGSVRSNPIVNFVNVDKATLLGVEFETRIGLRHFTNRLSNFAFKSNLSWINSTVDISKAELAQRLGIDSTACRHREMQGQSPFIVNLGLSYSNPNTSTFANLDFNLFGERLSKVSANVTPDVFEQPAARLNFTLSQRLFNDLTLKFSARNILNSKNKEVYKFKGKEFIYREYTTGIYYSLGLAYEL